MPSPARARLAFSGGTAWVVAALLATLLGSGCGDSRMDSPVAPRGPVSGAGDVQINNISMFELDLIEGGEDPASNWYSISGGNQILHSTDKTTGSDQFIGKKSPVPGAPIRIQNETWTVARLNDGTFLLEQWYEVLSDAEEDVDRSGTLTYMNDDGVALRTVDFTGVRAVSYHVDETESDGPLEVLEFEVESALHSADPDHVSEVVHSPAECWLFEGDPLGHFGVGGQRFPTHLEDVNYEPSLDLLGDIVQVDDWHLVRGGGMHCACPFAGVSDPDLRKLHREARSPFPEIELAGPFISSPSRAALLEWLNRWLRKGRAPSALTVDLLEFSPEPPEMLRSLEFHDVVPVEYHPPAFSRGDDAPLQERFVFKAMRVEDRTGP